MNPGNRLLRGAFAALAAVVLAAGPARADVVVATSGDRTARVEGIGPDGLLLELGLAAPAHGDKAFVYGVRVGMGTLLSRHLDFSLGLRRWSADIDRSDFGANTAGRFSDTALDAVLTYPAMRVLGLRPYLGAGVAAHVVGADVPQDRSLEDALGGAGIGGLALVGVGTTRPGLGVRGQARRDFAEDVGGWTYTLGVGWWPKTRAAKAHRVVTAPPQPVTWDPGAVAPAVAPAATPPPAAAGGAADPDVVRALNHLRAENAALATELARLNDRLAAMQAAPAAPPAAAAPAPAIDRNEQFFAALERVSALAGYAGDLRRDGNQGLLTLDQSLLFALGRSELTTAAREELRRLGVVFLRFPEARIVVQGHTDSSGQPATNQTLSERRAAAVRTELLAIGIAPDAVSAAGFGDTRPVADNGTPAGRARNRRVDLLIAMPSASSN